MNGGTSAGAGATPQANMDGFMTIPDGVDEDIPFM